MIIYLFSVAIFKFCLKERGFFVPCVRKMQPSATSNPSLSLIPHARLLDLIVPLSSLFRREKTSLTTPTPLTGRNTFLINHIGLQTLSTVIVDSVKEKEPLAADLLVHAAQLQHAGSFEKLL
jgi:hypothetical protein